MALDITFTLKDDDLEYFRGVMRKAQSGAGKLDESEILKSVKALSAEVKSDVPDFIASRLHQLDTLVAMVEDKEWQIPVDERDDVISALAYFGEAEDLIPDHIPALGFLDDAIMIELVVGDLRDNIDAFSEFCDFRTREQKRRDPSTITSADWLVAKRKELHSRLANRRSRRRKSSSYRIF